MLSERTVKMGPLLTVKTAPVNVQVNIQENIVKVRVLQQICLYTIRTTHILYNIYLDMLLLTHVHS